MGQNIRHLRHDRPKYFKLTPVWCDVTHWLYCVRWVFRSVQSNIYNKNERASPKFLKLDCSRNIANRISRIEWKHMLSRTMVLLRPIITSVVARMISLFGQNLRLSPHSQSYHSIIVAICILHNGVQVTQKHHKHMGYLTPLIIFACTIVEWSILYCTGYSNTHT